MVRLTALMLALVALAFASGGVLATHSDPSNHCASPGHEPEDPESGHEEHGDGEGLGHCDNTPPVVTLITPAMNDLFELGSGVHANYVCTDVDLNLVSCEGSVPNGSSIDTSVAALGERTFKVTGTDSAPSETIVIHPYTVQDTTPPIVTLTTPAAGAIYKLGTVVYADFTCTDLDLDLKSCIGTVPDGDPMNVALGSHSFTVTGKDRSKNTTVVTHPYTVVDVPVEWLRVIKIVVNDDGGTLGVNDFPLFIDGIPTTSGQWVFVTPGKHVVSETRQVGYTPVIDGDCDADGEVTIQIGNSATCTIINTFVSDPGSITVTKVVDNTGGGTALPSDFGFTLSPDPGLGEVFPVDGTATFRNLPPGVYSVIETTGPPKYAETDNTCSDLTVVPNADLS